jgi:desulfoferrodoxin-like iron-binding protein
MAGYDEEAKMQVKETGEQYRCSICGNEIVVTKAGGGELVCCKKPMDKVQE